jgi:hypothetical protein
MGVQVKVKVCADCFSFYTGRFDDSHLDPERAQEILKGFQLWDQYQFAPGEYSNADFLNATLCDICRKSLTKDRRQYNSENVVEERRSVPDGDRRTPLSRGSRVLLASLPAA